MTATTVPQQSVPARTWNSLLKLTVLLAVAVVLIAGSFALGRGTADDATTVVTATSSRRRLAGRRRRQLWPPPAAHRPPC